MPATKTKILLVSATEEEIRPFLSLLIPTPSQENNVLKSFYYKGMEIDALCTGAGMVTTSYHLTKALLKKKYDFAINAGIAGSFDKNLQYGTVVHVVSDMFPELGAEDDDKFLPAHEINLLNPDTLPFNKGQLHSSRLIKSKVLAGLPEACGITVNTVHGNEQSIKKTMKLFSPQVETMEGAAFMFVCIIENIPFAQVRSISNYVEKRNKSAWKIPLAIDRLNEKLKEIIDCFE